MQHPCVWAVVWILALALMPLPAAEGASATEVYYLMAFNNPVAGREQEFNRWYEQRHAPEVVSNAGVVSGQRFVAVELSVKPQQIPPRKYLAMYRIETSSIAATYHDFKRAAPTTGESPPLDGTTSFTLTYKSVGPRIAGAGPKSFGGGAMKSYAFFVLGTRYGIGQTLNVAAIPGFVSAQRLIRSDVQRDRNAPSPRYMVMYEISTDDLASVFAVLGSRVGEALPEQTHDSSPTERYIYEELGSLITRDPMRGVPQRALQ